MLQHIGWIAVLACGLFIGQAKAAEIRVITTGAMKEVVLALGSQFQKTAGHTLAVINDRRRRDPPDREWRSVRCRRDQDVTRPIMVHTCSRVGINFNDLAYLSTHLRKAVHPHILDMCWTRRCFRLARFHDGADGS